MICFPNAKINLGLDIVSKRPDGYHNIETVFYPIPVKDALEKILLKIAKDNNFNILEMGSDVDHIHLLVDCTPGHQIPNMLKALKGVSARLLLQSCPELKKALYGGNLWNPSYFVATVSENTEQQIAQYIKSQGGEEAG